MFAFFEPSFVKHGRQVLKDAQKVVAYRRDLWSEATLHEFQSTIADLRQACRSRDRQQIEARIQQLDTLAGVHLPPQKDLAWRENTEVFLVAIVVALGVRTFFLQPFTIPTGSMQPTLNGIIGYPTETAPPNLLRRLVDTTLFGRSWINTIAENEETVLGLKEFTRFKFFTYTEVSTDRGSYVIHAPARTLAESFQVQRNRLFHRGEPIARGYVDTGDHVFVDKITYHFVRPRRDQVFVFNTRGIPTAENRTNPEAPSQFYIKRLAGLPLDRLRIVPPELFINGQRAQGSGFEKVMAAKDGYRGYSNASEIGIGFGQVQLFPMDRLGSPDDEVVIPEKKYWAQGDNSFHSSDSRDWGPVPQENIMGRGLFVYWPFGKHWGLIH